MDTITLRELLKAVDGTLLGEFSDLDAPITGVCTDSRSIRPGDLFIPLIGEKADGHSFICAALDSGAAGCLTQRETERCRPGKFCVRVGSTLRALGDLARWYRGRFSIPFVCVTGSVGKTTTKDMVAAVLSERYRVHKTEGNFNNDIGLPLTLLGLSSSAEVCVLEMGMNHAGELEYLSGIAQPDVALITNIGDAHIGNLGSREGIFKAKCEIFSHMRKGGLAVLNGDDEWLLKLRDTLPFEKVFAGAGEGLAYRADSLESDGQTGLSCTVHTPAAAFRVDVPALGGHMIYPVLMAAAVGERFGMTAQEIARGVRSFRPDGMRMSVTRLPGDVTLLNDAYNAGPQSMQAAAAVLGGAPSRRRVAVLGDMLELGDEDGSFHRAVGRAFAQAGAGALIAAGALARYIAEGAREAGLADVEYFPDLDAALPAIRRQVVPGAAILVKASHAMHFERAAQEIERAANAAT